MNLDLCMTAQRSVVLTFAGLTAFPFSFALDCRRYERQDDGRGDNRRRNNLLSLRRLSWNLGREMSDCHLRQVIGQLSGHIYGASTVVIETFNVCQTTIQGNELKFTTLTAGIDRSQRCDSF